MKTENYKGFILHINDIVINPNNSKTQTVLVYKDNNFICASYADMRYENAINKAKNKIDKINN